MGETGKKFRAALVTLTSGRDADKNASAASELIRAGAAQGAHYVQTPENTGLIEPDIERLRAIAEPEERHRVLAALVDVARGISASGCTSVRSA